MRLVGCLVLSCCVSLVLCLSAPAGSADAGPDVMRVDTLQFKIAVRVEPTQRPNIKELQLFASADHGKTWQQVASLHPDGEAFPFEAPREGIYWFNLRIVKNDGTAEPRDVSSVPAALKVQVGAGEAKAQKDTANTVQELKAEVKVLRQQLEQVEKRLSEIEKAKQK
jgi:hypothetical protein